MNSLTESRRKFSARADSVTALLATVGFLFVSMKTVTLMGFIGGGGRKKSTGRSGPLDDSETDTIEAFDKRAQSQADYELRFDCYHLCPTHSYQPGISHSANKKGTKCPRNRTLGENNDTDSSCPTVKRGGGGGFTFSRRRPHA